MRNSCLAWTHLQKKLFEKENFFVCAVEVRGCVGASQFEKKIIAMKNMLYIKKKKKSQVR